MNEIEVLQDLMSRGYLIYENPTTGTWILQKFATPIDPKPTLPNGNVSIGVSSRQEALRQADEWAHGPKAMEYTVEVKFDDGLGPKFATLGTVLATSVDQAEIAALEKAEAHFGSKKLKWSSRVRPN
jgi:hypothetical protein